MPAAPPSDFGAPAAQAFLLSQQQAEAIVRAAEAGPHVHRRYQFFVWTQSALQALLPHEVLVCGAYQRQVRDLVFEAFHSIVLPADVLALLTDTQGPLLRALLAAWVEGRARPLLLDTPRLARAGVEAQAAQLRACGIELLVVHGVARPQRPSEVESFFVFASTDSRAGAPALSHLELMLPQLHAIWLRVLAAEREAQPATPVPRPAARTEHAGGVTQRERQILLWVREGKSNQEIAAVLGISPLTVKNHVQKILRKLGASNRAHAVAEAIALGLLDGRKV